MLLSLLILQAAPCVNHHCRQLRPLTLLQLAQLLLLLLLGSLRTCAVACCTVACCAAVCCCTSRCQEPCWQQHCMAAATAAAAAAVGAAGQEGGGSCARLWCAATCTQGVMVSCGCRHKLLGGQAWCHALPLLVLLLLGGLCVACFLPCATSSHCRCCRRRHLREPQLLAGGAADKTAAAGKLCAAVAVLVPLKGVKRLRMLLFNLQKVTAVAVCLLAPAGLSTAVVALQSISISSTRKHQCLWWLSNTATQRTCPACLVSDSGSCRWSECHARVCQPQCGCVLLPALTAAAAAAAIQQQAVVGDNQGMHTLS